MENFNTDESFWTEHPALKLAGPFKDLYKSDRSRNKAFSSKLAWTIKLIWDRKSDYYNIPETGPDNKIDLIFEDYFGDTKYYAENRAKVEELRDFYVLTTESVAKRTLRGIEAKLIERDKFIRTTEYYMGDIGEKGNWVGGTVDTLDKMMANTEKMYTLYDKARKIVEEEEQVTTMGGQQESLSDSEAI